MLTAVIRYYPSNPCIAVGLHIQTVVLLHVHWAALLSFHVIYWRAQPVMQPISCMMRGGTISLLKEIRASMQLFIFCISRIGPICVSVCQITLTRLNCSMHQNKITFKMKLSFPEKYNNLWGKFFKKVLFISLS